MNQRRTPTPSGGWTMMTTSLPLPFFPKHGLRLSDFSGLYRDIRGVILYKDYIGVILG